MGIQVYSGSKLITESYTGEAKTFNKDSDVNRYSDVTLKIVPKADSITEGEKIAAVHIVEITQTVSGSDIISTEKFVQNNILNIQETVSFENSGWNVLNPENYSVSGNALCDKTNGEKRWVFEGDGLEPRGVQDSVYKDVQLRAGKEYLISYLGARAGTISIYSGYGTDNVIVSDIKNSEFFTVPANGDGKIRIVYQPSGEGYLPYEKDPQWWERNKLAKLALTEVNCTLGTYEESEAKYADGTKGFDDITSCMDYAYYMLNNLFISEKDTNKTPYDGFKTITLTHAGNGVYEFVADISDWTAEAERYEVIYDTDTKDIRNDRSKAYTGEGLFLLDGAFSDGETYVSDMTKNPHNYHYALSSHSSFYYDENEDLYFEFTGDDDVYLFINGKLALDLGGAHLAANKKINLNDMKTQLGLEHGKVYEFDFFYLERHTDFSNFFVNTNIQLLDLGKLSLNFYQDDKLLEDGSIVDKGSEVEIEYQMESYVNGMTKIQFSDKTLGIEVGVNGFQNTKGTKISEDGLSITVYNKDGTVKETKIFQPSQSAEISTYFDGLTLGFGEMVTVRGILYQAIDRLDSEVSTSFSSPKYAGTNGEMVINSSETTGVINVKDTPSNVPPATDPVKVSYRIEYFRDGETTPFVSTTGEGNVGAEISRDTSVALVGYRYERTNVQGDVLRLVADSSSNVLKVYFVKGQTSGGNTQLNQPTTLPSNNNGEEVVNTADGSATIAAPLTNDMLPWSLSLVVILLGLAGLCFRVSRLRREEWD